MTIRTMLQKILRSDFLFFLYTIPISAILIYLCNKDLIDGYILNQFVGGWDGSGHYAIAKQYAESIFPAVWGWIPQWYNGMPFPQFYPPFFYYFLAFLYHLIDIPFDILFKIVLIASSVVTPPLLANLYYRHVHASKIASICVLLLTILLISAKSRIGFIGVSLSSILNNGLATQPIAFIFFVLWLNFFLGIEEKKVYKYYAGFFLFLVMLSNVHVTVVAFFSFILIFIGRYIQKRKDLVTIQQNLLFMGRYFFSGLLPLLIALFWYLPMITHYEYFTGRSFGWKWGTLSNLYYYHYYFPIFIVLGLLFGIIKRNILICVTATIVVLANVFFYIKLYEIVPTFPFHIDRWLGTTYFLLPILVIFVFTHMQSIIRNSFIYWTITISIIGYALHSSITIGVFHDDLRGIYVEHETEEIAPVLDYFKNKDGLILVEWYTPYEKPVTSVLDSYLGAQGNHTTYSIIRESSISSLFWVPIRNSISAWPECWGIKCDLAFDPEYLDNDMYQQVQVAHAYGVQHLVMRSKEKKEALEKTNLTKQIADFGAWTIYTIIHDASPITALERDPILVYSELHTKNKPERRFDFMSLTEEINLKRARTDITFAYADNRYIDASNTDMAAFQYVIFDTYNYRDLYTAIEIVTKYLDTKKIIALPSPDPLYKYLQLYAEKNKNILLIDNLPADNYENRYNEFVEKLDNFTKPPIAQHGLNTNNTGVQYSVFEGGISIQTQKENTPIMIKQSYFPTWKSTEGTKLYLASAGNNLMFVDNHTTIYFSTPSEVTTGHIISLCGLGITILFLIRDCFNRNKENL